MSDEVTSPGPASAPPFVGAADGQLKRLELAMALRDFQHSAIWEAQKHFTWFVSLIITAQLLVLTSDRIDARWVAPILVVASCIGVVLCWTGILVVRREAEFFQHAGSQFVTEYNLAFPEHPIEPTRHQPMTNSWVVFLAPFRKGGVRELFQALLLYFAVAFIAMAVYAVVIAYV